MCTSTIPNIARYIKAANCDAQNLKDLIELDLEYRWKGFFENRVSENCDAFGFLLLPTIDDDLNLLPDNCQSLLLIPELVAEEYRVWIRSEAPRSSCCGFVSELGELHLPTLAGSIDKGW